MHRLGAGSVQDAAFEPNDAGGLTLKAFAQQLSACLGQDAVREGSQKLWRLCFPTRHLRRKNQPLSPGYQIFPIQ